MSRINELIKELCPNGVIYKKYGDVFEIKTGKGITTKEATDDGLYPIISGGTTPMGYYHSYNRDENIVTVSRVGANAGFVHKAIGKYDVSDNTLIVDIQSEYNLKYVFYYLEKIRLNKFAKGGGQPLITATQLKEIVLSLPPLEKQKEIVDILDRFDNLCNDISKGLPAEIEARQKQYEFYRNKLLNFKDIEEDGEKETKAKGTGKN